MKEFFKNFFSADEKKTSTLVVVLLVLLGFALWQFVNTGDFSENIKLVIVNIIYILGGVNVSSDIISAIKTNKQDTNIQG